MENKKDEVDASWGLIGYCLRKMYEIDTESPSKYYQEMAMSQMERLLAILKR